MRSWAVVVVVVASVLATTLPEGETSNYIAKRIYLKYPSSFVNLTSDDWKLAESDDQAIVAVKFKTNSAVGQLYQLKFIRPDGTLEAKIIVGLADGNLHVDAFDDANSKVLNKVIGNHPITLAEQNMALNINSTLQTITFRISSQEDVTYEISKALKLGGTTLVVTLGGGGQSLIGCVALVAVSVGGRSPVSEVHKLSEQDVDACPENECANRDCNAGVCRMMEVAICDCYGTGFTGPNCRKPGSTVKVRNNDDEESNYIRFTPWEDDRGVRIIAMDFKFGEAETKEGVLVYGQLVESSGSFLKVYVVGTKGNVVLGNQTLLNFALSTQEGFHTIIIRLEEEMLALVADGEKQKINLDKKLLFKMIQFGAPPTTDGASEVGVTACLRNTYVDYYDVLDLMYQRDKKVHATKLRPCVEGDDFISNIKGTPMFAPDPVVPIVDDDKDDGSETILSESDNEGDKENHTPSNAMLFPFPANNLAKTAERKECEKSYAFLCENGATCEKDPNDKFYCRCADGYIGQFCQFGIYPRSCSEAHDFHGLGDGPTRLDLDGSSAIIEPNVALCQRRMTIVPHDMPPRTLARDASFADNSLLVLSYRDFKRTQLRKLIQDSGECHQHISYDCNNAPLRFEQRRTWFNTTFDSDVTQMGSVPNSCGCVDGGCQQGEKCNCDSRGIATDMGTLTGRNAGITEVIALHNDGDVRGEFTLGDLNCVGFEAQDKPIRFIEKTAVEAGDWTGSAVYFHFRTNDRDVTLFSIRNDQEDVVRAHLEDGHTVSLVYGRETRSIRIESQRRINDSEWHLLLLEVGGEQMRFSIDGHNVVGDLPTGFSSQGRLTIGDSQSGFIGCVRSLRINNVVIDLQELASNKAGVTTTCDDHCEKHDCRNGAHCFVDFRLDVAFCQCMFPEIHSGANCEIDINLNSSVSFHGGYLKYEQTPNALLLPTYFSFRTDQPHALLLFVHDHNNNFLQVHLSEEINITMALNNDDVVSTCTVRSQRGQEFGDMRWLQVAISHTGSTSVLRIDDDACTIRAPRKLATQPVRKFVNVQSDIVDLPVGLNAASNPPPFTFTFIAGVEQGKSLKDGSMTLRPKYETTIPKLLGCMRGFQVGGEFIDLQRTIHGYRPVDPMLVRAGCDVHCDQVDCRNGGHCSVAWKNYDPSMSKTTCDCSRTSYAGPTCGVDEGVRIEAGGWLQFNVGRELTRVYVEKADIAQLFKFAFSASNSSAGRQRLAHIRFSDNREFEVQINKNATINVAIIDDGGRAEVLNFNGNFSNGFRHFFVAQFNPSRATAILLDSIRQDFAFKPDEENLDLFKATVVKMGGDKDKSLDKNVVQQAFEGCVSNVVVDYQRGSMLRFTPISYLDKPTERSAHVSAVAVQKGACPGFQVPNTIPVYQSQVDFPVWDSDFQRHVYHGKVPTGENVDSKPSLLWILIIVVVLIAFFLLVFCLFRKFCKETTRRKPASTNTDEDEPLNYRPATYYPQRSPTPPMKTATSNYQLPPPNVDFNKVDASASTPRTSITSGVNGYFTAQEPPSDDDDFVHESDDESTIRHIDDESDSIVHVLRPNGMDRAQPHRMSSFRHGDPTAPRDSPLYADINSPRAPFPVAIPVPPPRLTPS